MAYHFLPFTTNIFQARPVGPCFRSQRLFGELWVSKRSRPRIACGTSELGFLEEDIAADFSVPYQWPDRV
jgi:hypothetical protein